MRNLRFSQVADLLGVSEDKARRIAKTDPNFPRLIHLGPRTNLVPEADLLRYVEAKRISAGQLTGTAKP